MVTKLTKEQLKKLIKEGWPFTGPEPKKAPKSRPGTKKIFGIQNTMEDFDTGSRIPTFSGYVVATDPESALLKWDPENANSNKWTAVEVEPKALWKQWSDLSKEIEAKTKRKEMLYTALLDIRQAKVSGEA